jgi:uncharacterized membrane protein
MNRVVRRLSLVLAFVGCCVAVAPAYAYIGPGAGLGAIGTLIAFVGAVLFAIVGFVWYPIKRLLRRKQKAAAVSGASMAAEGSAPRDTDVPPR